MIVDASQMGGQELVEADVCIVGAGPAGLALASALSRAGRSVVLLESGGMAPEPSSQALAKGVVAGHTFNPLDYVRQRRFGGTLGLWAGWCRPMERSDFDRRAWVPESGWPISYDEVARYYPGALDFLGVDNHAFDLPAPPVAQAVDLSAAEVESRLFRIAPRDHTIDTTARALATDPRVQVVLHANVREVVLDADGRVESLDVRTLAGRRFAARGREFVLALGGIETPRLLLASNSVRPEGAGNHSGQVGRRFMEHISFPLGAVAAPADDPHLFDLYTSLRDDVLARFWPSQALQERLGILSVSVELDPWISGPLGVARSSIRRLLRMPEARLENNRRLAYGSQKRTPNSVRVSRRDHFTRFRVDHIFEQAPNPASRVQLHPSAVDALGMPLAVLDWRFTDLDAHSARAFCGVVGPALAAAGAGTFSPPRGETPWPPPYPQGKKCHHMGTTRMSASPTDGVVDGDCRVHGVPNLSLAGSSVFPTAGAGVPTLTIVALALRLAERITADLAPTRA